jgi:hypothetical protein
MHNQTFKGYAIQINKTSCLLHLLCVGGIISLSLFSKELKMTYQKNNWLRGVILILLVRESIFIGRGCSVSKSAGA